MRTGTRKTPNLPKDLLAVPSKFPKWPTNDPPIGSLVVVKYTVSSYKDKNDELNISLNVMWVGVLYGDPEVT